MWMDHRASVEADYINSTKHPVLQYVGGKISLEMETPKLLWLNKNLPNSFKNTKHYFDLGDYLRWKATGCKNDQRSICCSVCKWTFVNKPDNGPGQPSSSSAGWDLSYFKAIGLEPSEILPKISNSNGKNSFPVDFYPIAPAIAVQLGLNPNSTVYVGFSMIVAHSGVLGMINCHTNTNIQEEIDLSTRLGIICGTSNCHMALNKTQLMIPGVWGPFYGVIFNDYYLTEGGQSAAVHC